MTRFVDWFRRLLDPPRLVPARVGIGHVTCGCGYFAMGIPSNGVGLTGRCPRCAEWIEVRP